MLRAEPSCSPRLLKALSHKVLQHLGMDFSGSKQSDLLRRLQLLAMERQVADFDGWLRELAFADWDAVQEQGLIAAFTVGETYFRRDLEAFDWLASHHLAPLVARRRQEGRRSLRLWSAGCCTGEEAYGLLFLIDELLGHDRAQWSVELVASDINAAFLARAEQGLYGQNAFRSNEETFRQRHFQAEGRRWRVRPAWRGRISFVQYNLADSQLPPALPGADLILCRNVLMYFSPGRALGALRRLLASLSADGLLLLSAVEAGLATQAGLSGRWAGCNYALSGAGAPTVASFVPSSAPTLPLEPAPVTRLAPRPIDRSESPVSITAAEPGRPDTRHGSSEGYWRQAAQALAGGHHEPAREALLAFLGCADLSRAEQHRACLALARSWADQHQVEQAREWLQRALDLDCAAPEAYWLEALLAQQAGDNQAALKALHKALYLDPEFILGYFLRARLLRAEGQWRASDKALQVCRQLLLTQDGAAPAAHGDGISCAQLLRLCDQLQQEARTCPSH